MKTVRWMRLLALLLVACVLFAGCSPTADTLPEEPSGNGQLYLSDTAGPESSLPYPNEYPAAGDEDALDTGRIANVSTAAVSENLFGNATKSSLSDQRIQLTGEIRAVWISYLEMENLLKGKTEAQFTANMRGVFDNCKDYGLNTVVVHVRPFGDALYSSSYYPWSYLNTGTEGVAPGYDPLEIMVREAHSRGLRIEAWLNPYRVRSANNANALSADNQAQKWLNSGDSAVIRYNGVVSYNPASEKARNLIVNGAVEIVQNYAVDGIHIDDYFYPTTDAAFDASSYNSYKNAGGSMSLANWRRSNVEKLVQAMYQGIKAVDEKVVFGIAPQSSIDNNYNAQYLDVEKIAANPGYCDYICPQIYFGFQNGTQPFQQTLETWNKMVANSPVQLYIGIAAYKTGGVDSWAGNGSYEWVNNADLLSKMVIASRAQSGYTGFVIYRYDSLFNPAASVSAHVSREADNLKRIL